MRLIYLYRYDPAYHFDKYLHTDIVPFFEKAGHKCMAYGPRLHEAYNDSIVLQPYRSETTLQELHEKYAFDVILLGTQSRMFLNYRPPLVIPHGEEIREGCILPPDFKEWNGLKVLLEEDQHYQDNTDWINEVKIDLVLQRHYSNIQRFQQVDKYNIPCKWLPFSVDTDLFKPTPDIERKNKLCLKATVVPHIYPGRQMLVDKLVPDLMDHDKTRENYIQNLQSYVGHGCCSSIFSIDPAKIFEICSSGSVLFTEENDECGIKKIFPEDCYMIYKKDGSDLKEKATKLLNDKDLQKDLTNKAKQCILNRHTHERRIKELVNILENL